MSSDGEVLKDVQFLSKFFAWHASSMNKTSYLKYRPAYNVPVKKNAKAYWRYAIKATIYMIRKERQDKNKLQNKRKNEMIELAEVYRLEEINKYFLDAGSTERELEFSDQVVNAPV